jgi:predicted phage terminase large subunit-like protein
VFRKSTNQPINQSTNQPINQSINMNIKDKKETTEWLALCERIRQATPLPPDESEATKRNRIAKLRADFSEFCKWYFPDYMDDGKTEFGWFHKQAAKEITKSKTCFAVLEWPREHAKSVFADLMLPLYLYACGELTGVIIVSSNAEKATGLLGDLQAQFTSNARFIHDYGHRAAFGDWKESHFATTDSCGFWSFGRSQSPRGARKASKRPNFIVVDDIDDKVLVRNTQRVKETVDWVMEDLLPCAPIEGARLIVVGNRIHKHSTLAYLVGDIESDQPKREGIWHSKVFALESKSHKKDMSGQPAWKERYTRDQVLHRIKLMGERSALREYFHEHIEEGSVFRNEWITFSDMPKVKDLEAIEIYCDPSFKDAKHNDFKAIVVVGKIGPRFYVLDCWVRQASVSAMVNAFYDFHRTYGERARYRMEANFIQDLLLKDFDAEALTRGYNVPLRPDKRDKPDKYTRVENLSPIFERGQISLNADKRHSTDMQNLTDQLLSFPTGHDDAPDALEGAVYYLNRLDASSKFIPRLGRFTQNEKRRF